MLSHVHPIKQPTNLRKTASKNSTKKLQQQLAASASTAAAAAAFQQQLDIIASSSRASSRHSSRVGSRVNSDDDDDRWSDASSAFGGGGGGYEPDSSLDGYPSDTRSSLSSAWETQLRDAIEALYERRARQIQSILMQHYAVEALGSHKDDLMDLLKKSIKRGGTRECVLAANVASIVFVSIGEDEEPMFQDITPLLRYTIANHEQTEVKASCIYVLGTACYISSTPQPSHLPTYEILNLLLDIIVSTGDSANAPGNPETLKAALESFSVLYASLFGHSLKPGQAALIMQARRLFNKAVLALRTLLDHSAVEVRTASGETLALMLEVLQEYQRQRDNGDYEEVEEEDEEALAQSEHWDEDIADDYDEVTGDFKYDGLEGLIQDLEVLSTDSSRHRSRKDRSAGRSAFRDILRSVENGERPSETLKLQDCVLDFDGWVDLHQLRFLRDRLASGLHTHFIHNTMIHSLIPCTAVLYSSGFQGASSSSGGGYRPGSRSGSRNGSRAGSRAGSRPPSSVGYYADAEDTREEWSKLDRKSLNSEVAKARQRQRKKDRGRGRFEDD
ncbi:Interferon- developmental regulator 1, partial [Lunasporangiospora selenospora]